MTRKHDLAELKLVKFVRLSLIATSLGMRFLLKRKRNIKKYIWMQKKYIGRPVKNSEYFRHSLTRRMLGYQ